MKAKNIRVTGKVQGVYFRVSAKQQAMILGVNGFVKNETDGSVYLEVEGENHAVDEMVNWCKKGPGLARVEKVEVAAEAQKNFVAFNIKK